MAEAPLPCSPAVLANPGVKSDLRRIRKAGLDYEVTRDPARMAAFYETMYVPYAGRSHGETAVVLPLERMQRKFDRCELLLVRKEGRAIAGTLIIRDEEGPRLWSLGVLDGNLEFLDYGVVGATNFFSFQHLAAQGHRRVALGFSRPFLRDGALQYKRKWGPSLTQPTPEGFSLQVHEWTPAVRSFLRNNPFVHVREESMEAAVFVEGEMPPLPADLETLKHGHLLPGLTRMAVFAMPADGRPAREMASLPFEMAPAPTAPNAGLNDNSFAAARCAGGMAPVR